MRPICAMLSEGGLLPGSEGFGHDPGAGLRARILPGIHALPREAWESCLPGEAESWAYHAACEAGASPELRIGAAAVHDGQGLVAAVPLFRMSYRLDTHCRKAPGGWGAAWPGCSAPWRSSGCSRPAPPSPSAATSPCDPG